MLDMHMHSTSSDGTYAPANLVHKAREAGLTHMALTDHDTVDGLAEASGEAATEGLAFLGGLEISAEYQPGTMHILGYGFDAEDPVLVERLREVQRARAERNPRIISKLKDLGLAITLEEVASVSGGGQLGRPHFAQVLMDKGYVGSRQEAFDRYLAKGCPAYVDKVRLSPEDSIAAIRGAGGVAVLAHPLQLKQDAEGVEAVVGKLVDAGLQGMECYYRNHTDADTAKFLALADTYGLIATGGSDFHGTNRPGIALGTGEGHLNVPIECWDRVIEKLKESD